MNLSEYFTKHIFYEKFSLFGRGVDHWPIVGQNIQSLKNFNIFEEDEVRDVASHVWTTRKTCYPPKAGISQNLTFFLHTVRLIYG